MGVSKAFSGSGSPKRYTMRTLLFLLFSLALFSASAEVIDDEIEIQGHIVSLGMTPEDGGALHTFQLLAAPGNFAGGDGLLQEGFGVGSFYVPNRRLNEKVEALDTVQDRPVLQFSYDCDGPNIKGLRVERKMELLPDEASVRVTWTVTNRGDERQWVAPWVRNDVTPGGKAEARDHVDIPTLAGIIQPAHNGYLPASRNWAALTDPIEDETLYLVFNANQTHSFLVEPYIENEDGAFPAAIRVQTAFVPFLLSPGEHWTTGYRMNVVRGLKHVDFATEEFATQVDYSNGKLTLLFSAVRALPDLVIDARVKAENGKVWTLPRKQFSLTPNRLARCTYEWTAPANGAYEILAKLEQRGKALQLGQETGSPHGGIDTRFEVGPASGTPFQAWTDAPHTLDQQPRVVDRPLIAGGPVPVWSETSLRKILPQDRVNPKGQREPVVRLGVAQGEAESFQIALRPPAGKDVSGITVSLHDLVSSAAGAEIPKSALQVFTEHYQHVVVPSHFEGPTGYWPDALLPLQSLDAPGGVTTPLWFTLTVPESVPAGTYSGLIEMQGDGLAPLEFFVEAEVFGFKLPSRPMLKTDFLYDSEQAMADHQKGGGRLTGAQLDARYLENATSHRVSLRSIVPFPAEQANLEGAMKQFKTRLDAADPAGLTTISIPPTLLNYVDQLAAADAFIKRNNLQDRAFVHLANEPPRPAWPRLLEGMQLWKDTAPDIPIMVTTYGLEPFLTDGLDIWAVHAPVFDTANGQTVLDRIRSGKEVWWYVDQTPPRPYGNFFLDFEAIDHRILFWQAWALGVRGMHYHGVNGHPAWRDPWSNLLDVTPVNGDGFLVYTDASGPVNSIRWENVRDGLEDFDYLAVFNDRRRRLLAEPGHEALLKRAAAVYNLKEVIPSLVEFTRDPAVLLAKRREIAAMIVEMNKALR